MSDEKVCPMCGGTIGQVGKEHFTTPAPQPERAENPYPDSSLPTNDFCYSEHDLFTAFQEGADAQYSLDQKRIQELEEKVYALEKLRDDHYQTIRNLGEAYSKFTASHAKELTALVQEVVFKLEMIEDMEQLKEWIVLIKESEKQRVLGERK